MGDSFAAPPLRRLRLRQRQAARPHRAQPRAPKLLQVEGLLHRPLRQVRPA